jgi:outer membrane protein OmpA-like peptidoglycan-associated protein
MNPGQLLLYVIPVEDRFAACMSAIQNELAAIGDGGRFSKEEIATANRQIALQAATRHDQSIPRLLESGDAWLLGQATDAGAQSVTLADMEAFARNYVQGRPHVAGLLINSEMVASIGPDTLFRPGTHAISVATVAIAASDDSVPAAHIPQYIDANTLQKMRVYFSKDPLAADSASLQLLQDIAEMLHDQPQKRIYLNSFSEGLGDGVVNYQMSVARAKAIRAWLVKEQGVPPAQIVIRAYGEAFPELANENDLRNRRMSFEYAPADAQDNVY